MLKILIYFIMIDIAFSKLTNDELYTLSIRVKELLSPFDHTELGILLYANAFLNQQELFSQSISKNSVSIDDVSMADSKRDDLSKGFVMNIRSFTFHTDQALKSAAMTLLSVIDSIGRSFYRESNKVQTAKMENLFKKIDEGYLTEVDLLSLSPWYALLKESQAAFETTLHKYTADKADKANIEAASYRRADLINAMRNLFAFLPMQAEITENESLFSLVGQLSEEVNRF